MAAFNRDKYKVTGKASTAFSAAAPCRYGDPTVKSYKTAGISGDFHDGSYTFPFVKDVDLTGINVKISGTKPTIGEFGGTPSFAQELCSKATQGEYLLFKHNNVIRWCQVIKDNSRTLVIAPTEGDNITALWRDKYGAELKDIGGLPNDAQLHRLVLILCGGGGSAGGWAYYDVAKNTKSDDNHIIPGTGGGGGGFGVCILNLDHLDKDVTFSSDKTLTSGKYFRIKVGAGGDLVRNRNCYYSHKDFEAGYNGNDGEDSFVRLESVESDKVTTYQTCTASGGKGGVGARKSNSEYADFDGERYILTAKNGFGDGGKWYWGNSTGNDRTNTGWIDKYKTIYYIAGESETTGGRGSHAGINKNMGDDDWKIKSPATSQIFWLPGIPHDVNKNEKAHKVLGDTEEHMSFVKDEKIYTADLVVNGGNSLGSGCHYLSTPKKFEVDGGDPVTLHFEPAQMGGGGACAGSGWEDKIAGKDNRWQKILCIGLGTAVLRAGKGLTLGPILWGATLSVAASFTDIGIGESSLGAGQPAPGYAGLYY